MNVIRIAADGTYEDFDGNSILSASYPIPWAGTIYSLYLQHLFFQYIAGMVHDVNATWIYLHHFCIESVYGNSESNHWIPIFVQLLRCFVFCVTAPFCNYNTNPHKYISRVMVYPQVLCPSAPPAMWWTGRAAHLRREFGTLLLRGMVHSTIFSAWQWVVLLIRWVRLLTHWLRHAPYVAHALTPVKWVNTRLEVNGFRIDDNCLERYSTISNTTGKILASFPTFYRIHFRHFKTQFEVMKNICYISSLSFLYLVITFILH